MKIIKHGKLLRFVCENCECEWQEVKKTVKTRLSKNRIRTDIGTDARNAGKTQRVMK